MCQKDELQLDFNMKENLLLTYRSVKWHNATNSKTNFSHLGFDEDEISKQTANFEETNIFFRSEQKTFLYTNLRVSFILDTTYILLSNRSYLDILQLYLT